VNFVPDVYIVKYIVTFSCKPDLPRDEHDEGCKESNAPQSFSYSNYPEETLFLLRIN
jgi:hypothetical protein